MHKTRSLVVDDSAPFSSNCVCLTEHETMNLASHSVIALQLTPKSPDGNFPRLTEQNRLVPAVPDLDLPRIRVAFDRKISILTCISCSIYISPPTVSIFLIVHLAPYFPHLSLFTI